MISDRGSAVRVCVVSPLYHPSLGGLGKQAQLLTEKLAKEGIKVFVIARRMKGMPPASFSPYVKVYRAWSLKPYLHVFEKITFLNLLVSLSFSLHCALLLFLRRKEYDIVHFHGGSLPLFLNVLLLKLLGKKIIAKVAAAGIGTEAGALRDRHYGIGNLLIRLLRSVDVFVATTGEIREGLRRDGFPEAAIAHIPNFIDPGQFYPASESEKIRAKTKLNVMHRRVVTFSGRLVPRKGIEVLIDSWDKVARQCPDAVLVVLGNGPLFDLARTKAADAGLSDSIVFQGPVESVLNFLHATDVFVLPSCQEGMPNSLLEAMACGLPSVATKIGGVTDIITDKENGLLTLPNDSIGLAEKILLLLKDRELVQHISSNALKTIKESYDLNGIIGKYIDLYERLMSTKNAQ